MLKAAPANDLQGNWLVDVDHSSVGFRVTHLMVSSIRGSFERFQGSISIDAIARTATVELAIEAASIRTNNMERDDHLRTNDFLDAQTHPMIGFRSTSVVWDGGGSATVIGDLTIRGVTRAITADVSLAGIIERRERMEVRATFEGHATLNRHDFGVNWNRTLEAGGWLLGSDVSVEIVLSVVREGESGGTQAA